MRLSTHPKQLLKQTFITVSVLTIAIAVLAGIITIVQAFTGGWFNLENRIAHETRSWETQDTVVVKHIARENGKEAIYTIRTFWGGEVKIPESTYLQYIGDGNNTITFRIEELTIYMATDARFSFDKAAMRTLSRVSYPWEDAPQKFTQAETEEVIQTIKAIEKEAFPWEKMFGTPDKWKVASFSFDFNRRSWGFCHKNCLTDGATRYKTPEINWWWNLFT